MRVRMRESWPAKAKARERTETGNETIPYHLERSIISILVVKSQGSGVESRVRFFGAIEWQNASWIACISVLQAILL